MSETERAKDGDIRRERNRARIIERMRQKGEKEGSTETVKER